MSLPRTFTLALYQGSVWRECEMVWTNGRSVGVKFTSKWRNEAPKARRFNSAGGRAQRPSRGMIAERTP